MSGGTTVRRLLLLMVTRNLVAIRLKTLIATDCNFDLCKFPKEDEEILPPAELLADYFKKRKALDHEIDKTLAEIQRILGINVNVDEL